MIYKAEASLPTSNQLQEILSQCITQCREKNITDLVNILRVCQTKTVTGRRLDVDDETEVLRGDTNFILVDRGNMLESTKEEINAVTDLRLCLEVQFYGELTCEFPVLVHFFTPGDPKPLTFKKLNNLLRPEMSADDSNRKNKESSMYSLFFKYIREAASGRREGVNLGSILQFVTGTDEVPVLGFSILPSIMFVEAPSFLPTSNTCINRLNMTIPARGEKVPDINVLYHYFDLAFGNTYFGLK